MIIVLVSLSRVTKLFSSEECLQSILLKFHWLNFPGFNVGYKNIPVWNFFNALRTNIFMYRSSIVWIVLEFRTRFRFRQSILYGVHSNKLIVGFQKYNAWIRMDPDSADPFLSWILSHCTYWIRFWISNILNLGSILPVE